MNERTKKRLLGGSAFLLLIVIWEAGGRIFGNADYFPQPVDTLVRGWILFSDRGFAIDMAASSARISVAFLASAILGVPLALWMSVKRSARYFFEPIVDFVRYVPVPALLPIFVLFTGIGELPKFLVLFFGTFFQLVLLVKDEADYVDREYLAIARTLGSKGRHLYQHVLIPQALPQIYNVLRVTLGWCWTYLVIAELIAVQYGVGRVLKESLRFNDAGSLFFSCFVLGVIGLGTDQALKALHPRLFPHRTAAK